MSSFPNHSSSRQLGWLDPSLSDLDEISIKGGEIHYKLKNNVGSSLIADLYVLSDVCPNIEPEILSKSTVGVDWDPLRSSIGGKFRIRHKLKAQLLPNEAMEFIFQHSTKRFPIAALRSQTIEPRFPVLIRGCDPASEVVLSLGNHVRYIVHETSVGLDDLSPWSDRYSNE